MSREGLPKFVKRADVQRLKADQFALKRALWIAKKSGSPPTVVRHLKDLLELKNEALERISAQRREGRAPKRPRTLKEIMGDDE